MARRELFRAAAGAAACGALAGCGAAHDTVPSATGAPIILYFQGANEPALHAALLPQFEALHPGIRVVASVPGSNGDTQVIDALLQGAGPDVFWSADPAVYKQQPLLADLAPLAAARRFDLGVFPSGQLLACTQGPHLYGLPRTCNPAAYAARTDVFGAAGIPVPDGLYTADELAALWRRLTIPGRRAGGEITFSQTSTFYLRGWGAHLVDPGDDLRCVLGSLEAIACGQWLWDRFWRDGSARGVQGENGWAAFGPGTLAMVVLPAQALPDATVLYAGLPWRVMPLPTWPAGPATSTTSEFYAIAAHTRHVEAAWELLTFITSTGWEQAAIEQELLCPARIALWPAYLTAVRGRFPPLAAQPLEWFSRAVAGGAVYAAETFRYEAPAAALLGQYLSEVFAPGHDLPVARGFRAAADAVTALQHRQALRVTSGRA